MKINDHTRIIADNGEAWYGGWGEFCAINEDMGEELDDIRAALERDETYHGGGAAATFTVRSAWR